MIHDSFYKYPKNILLYLSQYLCSIEIMIFSNQNGSYVGQIVVYVISFVIITYLEAYSIRNYLFKVGIRLFNFRLLEGLKKYIHVEDDVD